MLNAHAYAIGNDASSVKGMSKSVYSRVDVHGKVTDNSGLPLPGVSVKLKGTQEGTVTGVDGTYRLNTSTSNGTLVFSYLGFISQEKPFSSVSTLNVVLVESAQALNDVVVTGYNTEKKKDIVGSVTIVKTEDLIATPAGSVTQQLQGRSPGVTVSGDGTPGGGAKVRIRGFGSFGGSDPLYVVDGVPSTGSIDNLNPNDIESLQVLKDAAAASIYGARAANGVVIITTKQGKPGRAKISVDSYYGMNYFSKDNFPAMLNAQEYGEMYWQSMRGAGYSPGQIAWTHPQYGSGATPVIPEYILVKDNGSLRGGTYLETLKATNPSAFNALVDPANYDFANHQIVKSANTDWFAELFNPAPQQNLNVNASGGSDVGTYALTLGVFDQKNTATEYSYFRRYSLRANSNFKVKKNFRLGENVQFTYTGNRGNVNTAQAWTMTAMIPVYDIMGNPASSAAPGLVEVGDTGRNPITEAYRNRVDNNTNYGLFGNAYGEFDIVKGLTARSSFGLDYRNGSTFDFTPVTFEHAENTTISGQGLSVNGNINNTWTWSNTLNYAKTFAEKHSLKLLLGSEAIKTFTSSLNGTRVSANNTTPAYPLEFQETPDFLTLTSGVGTQSNSGTFTRNTLSSLFSRIDYSYDGKYLFNATVRRDESSKFGKNNRTGYFPAAAIGWRVSAENFMKGITWISDLKLRGSYGVIGNQNGLSNTNQYTVYTQSLGEGYPVSGTNAAFTNSYTTSSLGNPNARWERNITTNVGLDGSFLDNTIDFSFEWYKKETDGLLVGNQAPLTGFSGTQPSINAGNMVNRGVDIGLTKRGNIASNMKYEVALSFTKYKNNVTKVLDNPLATIAAGGTRFSTVPSLTAVGHPISQFYGYQIDGFFNSQAEVDAYNAVYDPNKLTTPWIVPAIGRWKITDVNGDKVINDLDRTFIGSPHPDFQTSANLNLGYKNLDFTAFIFWNQGGKIFNYSRYNTDFNTFKYNRSARMLYESWTPALGNNALLPKLDLLDTYSNKYPTTYYVEDASYVRLKTIQLGYTLSKGILSKLKVDKVRMYVQAQNLFTKTKFSGLDPDSGLSGGDTAMGIVNNVTPTPKQFLFGLNFGF